MARHPAGPRIEVGACLAFPRPEHAVNTKSFTLDPSPLHAPTSTQHSHSIICGYRTVCLFQGDLRAIMSSDNNPLTESSMTIPSDSEQYSGNDDLSPSPPSSSSSPPMILYSPPTLWGLVRGAAINLLLPFINGLMLGFGELFAHEAAFRLGWGGTKVRALDFRICHGNGALKFCRFFMSYALAPRWISSWPSLSFEAICLGCYITDTQSGIPRWKSKAFSRTRN